MALLIPNEGEVQLLTDALAGGTLENWTLKLFKNDYTPVPGSTSASFTEADFTNYTSKTLTRSISGSTWQTVTSGAPTSSWNAQAAVAKSTYGSAAQSWTCGTTGNTVYGYYVVGATSGKVIFAERFATTRTLASGDVLNLTPAFEFGSGSGS